MPFGRAATTPSHALPGKSRCGRSDHDRAGGTVPLPRCGSGSVIDRNAQLAWRKSYEARAPASIKALADDLTCFGAFHQREGGIGLSTRESKLGDNLEEYEKRQPLKLCPVLGLSRQTLSSAPTLRRP